MEEIKYGRCGPCGCLRVYVLSKIYMVGGLRPGVQVREWAGLSWTMVRYQASEYKQVPSPEFRVPSSCLPSGLWVLERLVVSCTFALFALVIVPLVTHLLYHSWRAGLGIHEFVSTLGSGD